MLVACVACQERAGGGEFDSALGDMVCKNIRGGIGVGNPYHWGRWWRRGLEDAEPLAGEVSKVGDGAVGRLVGAARAVGRLL